MENMLNVSKDWNELIFCAPGAGGSLSRVTGSELAHFKLVKRVDSWGEWFELERKPDDKSIYLGFKLIHDQIFEVSGNVIAYQPEYDQDSVPWTLVVSVESDAINHLLAAEFGAGFGKFPVIDSETETGLNLLIELKARAGYKFECGEFESDKDISNDIHFGM